MATLVLDYRAASGSVGVDARVSWIVIGKDNVQDHFIGTWSVGMYNNLLEELLTRDGRKALAG